MLDSIIFKGIYWGTTKELINDSFLKVKIPLKGGTGTFHEQKLLIAVHNDRILESLKFNSKELVEIEPIKESYEAKFLANWKTKEYSIFEKFDYQNNSNEKKWVSDCPLLFDPEQQYFIRIKFN